MAFHNIVGTWKILNRGKQQFKGLELAYVPRNCDRWETADAFRFDLKLPAVAFMPPA